MPGKLILVGGYCAAGKTVFSRELARTLNIPVFNKDTIKEIVGEGFGRKNAAVHQKNSDVTFMLMLHIAECFLKAGTPCILESNFKLAESKQIAAMLEGYDCECLTFLFKGNLDVLFKRYIERERSGERHWVHLAVSKDALDSFKAGQIASGLAKASVGQTVYIDATDFSKIDYSALFDTAKAFLYSNPAI
ncbi:MAG: ATP-binding protein [Oscillospiraceae bacterium]|nr:ATP-binding protein [Oscillospiraceae bacterium]